MGRLPGFDYKRPFFYMVTLKKLPGLPAFSRVVVSEEPPADGRYLQHSRGRGMGNAEKGTES